MISYWCLIVTYGITQLLYQIYAFENLSDLHIDLSMSLKVKCGSAIGLPIYGFLLMFQSNIWPMNSAPLPELSLRALCDLCVKEDFVLLH